MRLVAYCSKRKTIVMKDVTTNKLLCLHDGCYTETNKGDRLKELNDIYNFLKILRYGKIEFSETIGLEDKIICLKDYEVINSIGSLELHKEGENIMIDFEHNQMFRYTYDHRNEIVPYEDIDIRTLFIH
jgi:hypothetical protein